jgi:hypothetical protein
MNKQFFNTGVSDGGGGPGISQIEFSITAAYEMF